MGTRWSFAKKVEAVHSSPNGLLHSYRVNYIVCGTRLQILYCVFQNFIKAPLARVTSDGISENLSFHVSKHFLWGVFCSLYTC